MAFNPRGEWTDDAQFASCDDVQYNNTVLEDERMAGSDTGDSSGNESEGFNQDVDYRELERVIGLQQQRRSDGMRPGSGSQTERAGERRSGTQASRLRSVAGIRLFTSGAAAASAGISGGGGINGAHGMRRPAASVPSSAGISSANGRQLRRPSPAVVDCSRVEDITAVGTQPSPSAFTPVVPSPSSPVSPPST